MSAPASREHVVFVRRVFLVAFVSSFIPLVASAFLVAGPTASGVRQADVVRVAAQQDVRSPDDWHTGGGLR